MQTQKKLTKFYIVRHGQTEWNTQGRVQGHSDSPLTDEGVLQAQNTARLLRQIDFDRVFASDLMRAKRTAQIIKSDRKLAVVTTEILREVSFGRFEGRKVAEMVEELREEIDKREQLSENELMKHQIDPEIESYDQTATRTLNFLREVAIGYPGQTILIVTHANVVRSTLIKLGFATNAQLPHGSIRNAGFALIEGDGVDFFVKDTFNITLENK